MAGEKFGILKNFDGLETALSQIQFTSTDAKTIQYLQETVTALRIAKAVFVGTMAQLSLVDIQVLEDMMRIVEGGEEGEGQEQPSEISRDKMFMHACGRLKEALGELFSVCEDSELERLSKKAVNNCHYAIVSLFGCYFLTRLYERIGEQPGFSAEKTSIGPLIQQWADDGSPHFEGVELVKLLLVNSERVNTEAKDTDLELREELKALEVDGEYSISLFFKWFVNSVARLKILEKEDQDLDMEAPPSGN